MVSCYTDHCFFDIVERAQAKNYQLSNAAAHVGETTNYEESNLLTLTRKSP